MRKPITVVRNELASLLLGLTDRDVERVISFARELVERARDGRSYGETIDKLGTAVDRLDGRVR